ncbi:MAG TPA: glycosyltransferase family 39 protein [Pilimelia sp.]|nr:glycosyltransferase family 39 protein [Pilimelia sp.]
MVSASPVPADVVAPPRPAASRWRRWWARYWVWASAAVAAGVVVRVHHWWTAGSLNSDELWIALNLRRRSYPELAGPLDYDQLAPLGWLWLEKSLLAVGHGDRLLRAPSLVAGCATLVLVALLARRLLPGPPAVAAVVLCAGAPQLIYQSAQVKQYAVEASAALLLLFLAVRAATRPGRRAVAGFWLTAAVAAWFATTAVFVALSAGALLVLFALRDRHRSVLLAHGLAAAPVLGSFAGVYALAPPPADWLHAWWSSKYPGSLAPPDLDPLGALVWSAEAVNRFVYSALHAQPAPARAAVVVLLALGVAGLVARAPRPALLVCAPLACGYLLALLRLYPLATRVALWLVPPALLLVCAAIGPAAGALSRVLARIRPASGAPRLPVRPPAGGRAAPPAPAGPAPIAGHAGSGDERGALPWPRVLATGLLVLAAAPWWGGVPRDTNADRYATAAAAVRYVAAHRHPGDRVLVHHAKASAALVAWYGPGAGLRPEAHYAVAHGPRCREAAARVGLGAGPVWLLRLDWEPRRRTSQVPERAAMSAVGRLADERWFGRVVVLRYATGPAEPTRPSTCLVHAPAE